MIKKCLFPAAGYGTRFLPLTKAKQGMVLAYQFKGTRFDCGSVDGFVEATNYFYELEKKN